MCGGVIGPEDGRDDAKVRAGVTIGVAGGEWYLFIW